MTPALTVHSIYKSFDDQPLLRGVSFEIARGEIACLLGPSGSGKSTLLRIIAGLESPESGAVVFEGQDLAEVPTHARGLGLMFQDLALFPHRTVFDNIAFGLRMQRLPHAAIEARVHEMLALVGLKDFAARDIHHLAGGEQQRVALARAVAPRPRLLMFDEPLGALDRILREQLQAELRAILKRIGMTALYVTHDQTEAFAVADRVLVVHAGVIAQSGAPRELYENPTSAFVARFLGLTNLLPGTVERFDGTHAIVKTPDGEFRITERALQRGARVTVLIRPTAGERFETASRAESRENVVSGRVLESRFHAEIGRATIETLSGTRLVLETDRVFDAGTEIQITLNAERIMLLRA